MFWPNWFLMEPTTPEPSLRTPARRGSAIEPEADSQESVYNELRARGSTETLAVAWYIFSEAAVRRMTA